MSINGIWAYLLLEALFIAVIVILALLWLYLRQRKQWRNNPPSEPDIAVPANKPYPAALAQHIEECENRLKQLDQQTQTPAADRRVVMTRLICLRAELAGTRADTDSDKVWTGLGDALQELGPDPDAPSDTDDAQHTLIQSLRARIQAYTMRIANLEKFKTNFFELKQQYTEAIHRGREVQIEVDKALPDAQRTPELTQALQRLEMENAQLEQQLAQVEEEFENIMRNIRAINEPSTDQQSPADISDSIDHIGQSMTQIKRVIDTQDDQIQELQAVVSRLELEIQDKDALQRTLDALKEQKDQLSDVLAILEEENTFLQQQVAALLEQGLTEEQRNTQRAREAEARLQESRKNQAELEERYATIEQKYLAACEEIDQLRK